MGCVALHAHVLENAMPDHMKALVGVISEDDQADLKKAVSERVKVAVTMLADVAFLILWATSTCAVAKVLERLELSDTLDLASARAFQIIFSVSTLIPVLLYTIVDIVKVVKYALKQIKEK